MNTSDLFIRTDSILYSINYFDELEHLYEAADILCEADGDSLKEDDKRIHFNVKETFKNLLKVLSEWFSKFKNALSSFFNKAKNINHKKIVKQIFTNEEFKNKKVKIYDYMNMQSGVNKFNQHMNSIIRIGDNMIMNNNDNKEELKTNIAKELGISDLGKLSINSVIRSWFMKGDKKIKITINQLNEQIVLSYLDAQSTIYELDKWKSSLTGFLNRVEQQIARKTMQRDIDSSKSKSLIKMAEFEVGLLEKMSVRTIKLIQSAHKQFMSLVTAYGNINNINQ